MIKESSAVAIAGKDVVLALYKYPLASMLGWQDVRQRYRRSTLGPFWLTISMGVMIGTIGIVFGTIFESPMNEYLPFLAAGLILWTFISNTINEGCIGFVAEEGIIKHLPLPLFIHILRLVWRNVIILGHNILIMPLVMLAVGKTPGLVAFLSVVGFFLVLVNLAWVALVVALLCARYRDLPQIVASILQVLFYLTPIVWMPGLMPERVSSLVLSMNPIFHLLEVVRGPMLGTYPSGVSWVVAIALAIIGWSFSLSFYGRYRHRVAYWL